MLGVNNKYFVALHLAQPHFRSLFDFPFLETTGAFQFPFTLFEIVLNI